MRDRSFEPPVSCAMKWSANEGRKDRFFGATEVDEGRPLDAGWQKQTWGGLDILMSSVHEQIAWSGYSAYTASKAALGMLTKTLAQEAAAQGVRVLAVGPGAIRTPINRTVWANPGTLKLLRQKIPLNRLGEPDEIARMVVVLVSDTASYITGRTIFVDGGMTDYPSFIHGG